MDILNIDQFFTHSFDFIGAKQYILEKVFSHLVDTIHATTPLDVLDSIVRSPQETTNPQEVLKNFTISLSAYNVFKFLEPREPYQRSITPVSSTEYQSLPEVVSCDKATQTEFDDIEEIHDIEMNSDHDISDVEMYTADFHNTKFQQDKPNLSSNESMSTDDDEESVTDEQIAAFLGVDVSEFKTDEKPVKKKNRHNRRFRAMSDRDLSPDILPTDEVSYSYNQEDTSDSSEFQRIRNVDSFFLPDTNTTDNSRVNIHHNQQLHHQVKKVKKTIEPYINIHRDGYNSFSLHIVYAISTS